MLNIFCFQAEDGIRTAHWGLGFRRVLFRYTRSDALGLSLLRSGWSSFASLRYAFLMSASLAPRDTPNVEYGSAIYSSVRLTYGRTSARTRPNARGSAEDAAAALVCPPPRPLDPAQRIDPTRRRNRRRHPTAPAPSPPALQAPLTP